MALSAKVALAAIFDLNCLLQLIELVNFSWAFLHKCFSLLNGETILTVNLILVQGYLWLFMHDAGGNWGPFGVLLANAFLGLELEFKLLFGSKLHDDDWILWLSCLVINKLYWLHRNIFVPGINISRLNLINIWSRPFEVDLKIKIYGTPITISLAVTLIKELIIIHSSTDQWNQPAAMR